MPHQLKLDVWREACRHIHIEESTVAIAALIAEQHTVGRLFVRRIDLPRSGLETVAVAPSGEQHPPPGMRSELRPDQLQQMLAWCSQGRLARRNPDGSGDAAAAWVVPAAVSGEAWAGPLCGAAGPSGVLVLEAHGSRPATAGDEALLESLLEPFAVALDNDQRMREMAALREAAEADKRSLLIRLGRQKLGETIVGEESGLRGVMQRVELVAKSDVPVLIFGETGTGKELVARAIHTRSAAVGRPLHARQLRRHSDGADRLATLRPRAGRFTGPSKRAGLVRAGRRRHALSGRNRRIAARRPGPPAPHAAGRLAGARGRAAVLQRRRADRGRHAPRPGGDGPPGAFSRGPVVPHGRVSHRLPPLRSAATTFRPWPGTFPSGRPSASD